MDNFLLDALLTELKTNGAMYMSENELDGAIREPEGGAQNRAALKETLRVMGAAEKAMRDLRVAV